MFTHHHTTQPPQRNGAKDRIKQVIREGLALSGIQFDALLSRHFITPGVMVFQILICRPDKLGIHDTATVIFNAFCDDITLQSIAYHGEDRYAVNLRVKVDSALADPPTTEAA